MGSELPDYHKEDRTMFFLFVFFLLHTSVTSAEECPDEKTVGNTCYTKVAMIDTTEYGCMENCTYKKTQGSDSGLYCFKHGILPVTESECVYNGTDTTITDNPGCVIQPNTQMVSHGAKGIPDYFPFHSNSENVCAHYCHAVLPYCEYWTYNYGGKGLCWLMTTPGFTYPYGGAVTGNKACTGAGAGPIEPGFDIGVTCGSGIQEQFCFQCGDTKEYCQGNSPNSSCVLTNSGNCIPRSPTNEFDFGPYMGSVLEALVEFEDNTDSDILFPNPDSCGFFQKIQCLTQLGVGLAGCVSCKLNATCWLSCLKDKICGLSSSCSLGGSCFDDLLGKISSALGASGLSAQDIGEISEGLRNF